MKFSATSAAIHNAIKIAKNAAESKSANPIPVLCHLHLWAGDGKVVVRGTDVEVGVKFDAEVADYGQCCIDAYIAESLLKKLPDSATVEFEKDEASATVRVRSGRSCFTLQTRDANGENEPDRRSAR